LLTRSSQHFQKIKKQTKDGTSEPSTPRKQSVATNKTPTSGKSTGSKKRKQAESFNAPLDDDEEPSLSYSKGGSAGRAISVDGNGSPKKIKTEHSLQDGPICKTEELTEDGAVDLVDDGSVILVILSILKRRSAYWSIDSTTSP